MSSPSLEAYIGSIQSHHPTVPAIVDAGSATRILESLFGGNAIDMSTIKTGDFPNLFVYDVPEGKSEFNIATVHMVQKDMSMTPYDGKSIFVLNHFDRANHHAQNALLKSLEDHPSYAVILLIVWSPNEIIDTIHSRTLYFFQSAHRVELDPEVTELLNQYLANDPVPWIAALYTKNPSREEAIAILTYLFPHLQREDQDRCLASLEALFSTYESPRNILEAFFFNHIT